MARTEFSTSSTSRRTADVSPVVLREGDRVRLVFQPTLVDNAHNAAAAVNGVFVWQRKKTSHEWESIKEIPLSKLKTGEGYQLDLHSGEVLALLTRLAQLYELARVESVPSGVQEWLTMPRSEVLSGVREILEKGGSPPEKAGLLERS